MTKAKQTPQQKPKLVSVLMAAYNHEAYITRAIESVYGQSHSNWELLICDDGSSDRTFEIASRVASEHAKRVRVFRHDGGANRGQEATRNFLLEKASGDFLCLLDSDDFFEPKKLEILLAVFERKPEIGLAYGQSAIMHQSTGRLIKPGFQQMPEGHVLEPLLENNFITAPAVLFRRECLKAADGKVTLRFDERFKTIGEYPVWIGIAKRWPFAAVHTVVATWRDHGKNQGALNKVLAKKELVELLSALSQDQSLTIAQRSCARRSLSQKEYDLASEHYWNCALSEAQGAYKQVLFDLGDLNLKLKAKALAHFAVCGLGADLNKKYFMPAKRLLGRLL